MFCHYLSRIVGYQIRHGPLLHRFIFLKHMMISGSVFRIWTTWAQKYPELAPITRRRKPPNLFGPSLRAPMQRVSGFMEFGRPDFSDIWADLSV